MFESSQESKKVAQRSGSDTLSASTPHAQKLIHQSNDEASVVYAMLIGIGTDAQPTSSYAVDVATSQPTSRAVR